ncbi:MAG: hypothetical protein MN733_08355 [Nitrososphaera sp.]|nr:hypothetical protein [Nitrososphaera sp.]
MTKFTNNEFFKDIGILVLSILVAIVLVQTRVLAQILTATQGITFLSSFVAGIFFTSIFTTAPAIAALIEIAQTSSLVWVSFFGAFGAMCGDFLMFRFMRDRFSEHLLHTIHLQGARRRLKHFLKPRLFRRLTFVIGGLIIASPLPDELGLTLLGLSKTKTSWFLPLAFVCNFAGILLVGLVARALL